MRDWLAIRRAATPDALALLDATTDDRRTYADLDDAVEDVAGKLQALGLTAGDAVGVVMETRPAYVELLWAVQRLGATLAPFNTRLTSVELSDQRTKIEPAILVTDRDNEETAVEASGRTTVVSVDEPTVPETHSLDATTPEKVERVGVSLSETAAVLFTSGTTGEPTAVRITARNVLASAVASAFRLGVVPDDRWLLCLPMYHMGGLSIPIRTMAYGTTTVLQGEFDPGPILRTLRERSITGVSLVPTMLERLLEAGSVADSLRFALVGGGPTSAELAQRALGAGVPIHPTYGMTETASQITTATPRDVEAAPDSVGRPLVGIDLAILDGTGNRVGRGERGEIAVSGWTVSPGPVSESSRRTDEWFRTGDIGYRDEKGRLYVTGRASDLIVTGGENVVPGEVRAAILAHPAVEDAAVVGLTDAEWGERVGALVVATEPVSKATLRSFLEERLAGFKRPRSVAFADALPRTHSGTVDREAVRDRLREAER